MKTSSQSSSSSVNTSDVDALGQRTDHLIYNCYEFEKSTNSLNEYRHWIKEKETANVEVLEKVYLISCRISSFISFLGTILNPRFGRKLRKTWSKNGQRY